MNRGKEAYAEVAKIIARCDVPGTFEKTKMVRSESNRPRRWTKSYASDIARHSEVSQKEAAKGIREAFKERCGISPEKFLRAARREHRQERGRDDGSRSR